MAKKKVVKKSNVKEKKVVVVEKAPKVQKENKSTTNVGFEEKLWLAADKLRAHMDAAVYKHVVLGLVFLKYVSDSFVERYNELKVEGDGFEEEKDAYSEKNVFWVPKISRWENIKNNAKKPGIGKIIDDAMVEIEKENKTLKGVLQKDYARPDLDKRMLGELVDLISSIELGNKASKQKDLLGRVYEYFLGKFASAEGKLGGQFYTPACIVKLLVEMIEPLKGRIYDPACGSGGMFVQSVKFLEAHGGKKGQLSIFGQESNPTTWKLCKMNLAIRGLDGDLGEMNGDTFHNDQHKDLKADYILANPPFNISDWGGDQLKDDPRWKFGLPPTGNANYAWLQHIIFRLNPNGIAGIVLANGSLSSNQSNEGEIRRKMIEADIVDCIISLPGQLFYTTTIPASLWFLSRNKKKHGMSNRSGKILFIDFKKSGVLLNSGQRELTDDEISLVSNTYHSWRGENGFPKYEDKLGFCSSVDASVVLANNGVLTPGRYVGADEIEVEYSSDSITSKMQDLTEELVKQFERSKELNELILKNMHTMGIKFES